jgi:sodium-dependent dicarboxylate transporter 2/3/5
MNILKWDQAVLNYIDKVVFLFFGGFVLGLALEKWNLHKRLALGIVKVTGTSPNKIILGFIIATAFISMWISNTATSMMMYPIALSVNALIEANYKGSGKVKNFSLVLMLIVAYASNIGGIMTIVGTPPNIVLISLMKKGFNVEIDFFQWFIICFPMGVLILSFMYVFLTFVLYPNKMDKHAIPRSLIVNEYNKLGKMSKQEWIVALVFIQTCLLWIIRDQLINLLHLAHIPTEIKRWGWAFKFDDTAVALWGAFLMLVIPSGSTASLMIMNIKDLKKVKWGILLLFGGGLCLAMAMEKSGLMQLVGSNIASNSSGGHLIMIISLTLAAVFLSELMSNVALVTVFVPVVGTIAIAMNANPMLYCLPVTLGATCAFMLPMGTPPNAIVYASKKIKLYQMTSAGFFLNIISSVFISAFCYLFIDYIF